MDSVSLRKMIKDRMIQARLDAVYGLSSESSPDQKQKYFDKCCKIGKDFLQKAKLIYIQVFGMSTELLDLLIFLKTEFDNLEYLYSDTPEKLKLFSEDAKEIEFFMNELNIQDLSKKGSVSYDEFKKALDPIDFAKLQLQQIISSCEAGSNTLLYDSNFTFYLDKIKFEAEEKIREINTFLEGENEADIHIRTKKMFLKELSAKSLEGCSPDFKNELLNSWAAELEAVCDVIEYVFKDDSAEEDDKSLKEAALKKLLADYEDLIEDVQIRCRIERPDFLNQHYLNLVRFETGLSKPQ